MISLHRDRGWDVAALALIAVVYLPSLSGGFLVDDWAMIADNGERMRGLSAIQRFFAAGVWESSNLGQADTALYRPVWLIWNFAQYNLFGEAPTSWRAASLALHMVNMLLVVRLLGALLPGLTRPDAVALALIFALQPTKPQGVAWISGSTDPLLTVFFLGAVLLFLRHRRMGSIPALAGTLLCYGAAMLTKEPGIVLPAVLVAIDLWGPVQAGRSDWHRQRIGVYGALAAMAVGFLAVRHAVLGGALQGEDHFALSAASVYRLAEFGLAYLGLLALSWPVPFYYGPVEGSIAGPATLIAGAVVCTLIAVALWCGRIARIAAIWIVATLAAPLALALHQFGIFGPRFLYLPSVGAVLLAGVGYLWVRQRQRRLAIGISMVASATLAGLTMLELPAWRDELALASHALASATAEPRAWTAQANHYLRHGEPEKAAATWRRAAAVTSVPSRAKFLDLLALHEAERGRYEASLETYREISTLPGFEADGFIGMGNNYWVIGRPAEALAAYDSALAAEPANPLALYNLARLSETQGDNEAALTHYRRLLDLPERPGFEAARAHARDYVARRGGP